MQVMHPYVVRSEKMSLELLLINPRKTNVTCTLRNLKHKMAGVNDLSKM